MVCLQCPLWLAFTLRWALSQCAACASPSALGSNASGSAVAAFSATPMSLTLAVPLVALVGTGAMFASAVSKNAPSGSMAQSHQWPGGALGGDRSQVPCIHSIQRRSPWLSGLVASTTWRCPQWGQVTDSQVQCSHLERPTTLPLVHHFNGHTFNHPQELWDNFTTSRQGTRLLVQCGYGVVSLPVTNPIPAWQVQVFFLTCYPTLQIPVPLYWVWVFEG
jgi:hypothetical protein